MSEKSASVSSSGTTTDETTPTFLTIGRGGDRVYCVGCKAWQPSEGYCEGDPDICPIGEEDQGRSPSLAEAQNAIDLLAAEMRKLDDDAAEQIRALQSEVAQLRSSQPDSSLRAAEPLTTEQRTLLQDLARGARTTGPEMVAIAKAIRICDAAASSPTVTPPQTPTYLAELRDFAQRAYVLLANMTDDDECERDHHGNCQTHGLERDCSNARSGVLLDEYTELFDELFSELDSGAASPPVTEEAPNEDTALLDLLESIMPLEISDDEPNGACRLTIRDYSKGIVDTLVRATLRDAIRAARSTPTEEKINET